MRNNLLNAHLFQIPIPRLLLPAPSSKHRRFLEECHPPMLWFVPSGQSQLIHGFQWGIATHCPRPEGRGTTAESGADGGSLSTEGAEEEREARAGWGLQMSECKVETREGDAPLRRTKSSRVPAPAPHTFGARTPFPWNVVPNGAPAPFQRNIAPSASRTPPAAISPRFSVRGFALASGHSNSCLDSSRAHEPSHFP